MLSVSGFYLWILLVSWRIFNAIIVNTYFDPDEYWQSIEIAHHTVFGYGWVTWEWLVGLRSWLYPLPFVAYFSLIKHCNLDGYDHLVVYGPRVLQACAAATVDYLTYLLAWRVFQKRSIAESALSMSVLSWFNFFYSTRTISNNLESLLALVAVLFWPMQPSGKFSMRSFTLGLFFVGISVLVRPSAVTHWILPAIMFFLCVPGGWKKTFIGFVSVLIALVIISLGLFVDSWFYGKISFTWWTFVRLNLVERISDFYGTSPWHFHISQTLPAMSGTMLPLIAISLFSKSSSPWISQFVLGSVVFNSLTPHKEIRFLCPLVPFLMMLAGHGRYLLGQTAPGRWMLLKRAFMLFVLTSNIACGFYFSRVHQSGVISVMDHLREQIDKGHIGRIYFAMPCHSTPLFGYLHRKADLAFVTCEPPISDKDQKLASSGIYQDEGDLFYLDPVKHLHEAITPSTRQVVLYEQLLSQQGVREYLYNSRFRECWRRFNSHFSPDPRRSGDVLLYCR